MANYCDECGGTGCSNDDSGYTPSGGWLCAKCRNKARADAGEDAINSQTALHGDNGVAGDNLTDILANLMHWAAREGVDFDRSLGLAQDHYARESDRNAFRR